MHHHLIYTSFLFHLGLVATLSFFVFIAARAHDSLPTSTNTDNTCQYYLAESSIPHSGFGVYTVKAIPKGTYVMPNNSDAPSIVVTDIDLHNQGQDVLWNHVHYVWAGEGWADYESDTVWESVPNFGSLCNFHTYLYNIKPIAAPYEDTLTSRHGASPGMGAYTYYGGYNFKAVKDIDAGDEIFANYGTYPNA